jgi:hypothetical protein
VNYCTLSCPLCVCSLFFRCNVVGIEAFVALLGIEVFHVFFHWYSVVYSILLILLLVLTTKMNDHLHYPNLEHCEIEITSGKVSENPPPSVSLSDKILEQMTAPLPVLYDFSVGTCID